ncbi:LOW QUALITY PROTEIN: adenylate-forming reductase 03009 [Malania oleifera]|uniref:LOW QUALITY PROTEIN: adenylate-forming reductase 03009 n=1 Tax=Malania oleifera TaxID=397392 RepID=UPI0025AE8EBD|nr:LOW QUALITY PROTEIN: adenylate-forming reductase 03009 [Malania oleifera]
MLLQQNMENPEKVPRFPSFSGVAFEIKSHTDPFAVSVPISSCSKRFWLPENQRSSQRVYPSFDTLQRSLSQASSHFCDLDDDETEDDAHAAREDVEEGRNQDDQTHNVAVPLPQSKAAPKKNNTRLKIILLDQGLFSVYKRLFLLTLILNVAALVIAACGHFPYAKRKAVLFSIGNLFALTLCRSEAFMRAVFWLAVKALGRPWVPLPLKTVATSFLQSLGGIHSGCGVSCIAWLVFSLVLTVEDRGNTSREIIAVASTILALLSLSASAAFPLVRHLHHNAFERIHRFAGWASLSLLWAFILLTSSYNPNSKTYQPSVMVLIKEQEFWLTLCTTILIIVPWLTVRRVPVEVFSPSTHASIIKFAGGVKPGMLGRISPSPLSEWHAFGIISDGGNEHLMLAGAVGDFTKSLVATPPSHLWVRKVRFAGLPYLVNMYGRVVLVARVRAYACSCRFCCSRVRRMCAWFGWRKGLSRISGRR